MCKKRLQSKYKQSIFYHYYENNFGNNAIDLEHNKIPKNIITLALTSIRKAKSEFGYRLFKTKMQLFSPTE